MSSEDISVSIAIPFPSERSAQIAFDVLSVDSEPKRSHVRKNIKLEGKVLKANFTGDVPKNVRVGVTNFYETLILCCETQNEFGPPVSDRYDHY